MEKKEYKIEIDPRILELLGPNLYTNIYYVLAELIANAYDADAHNVYIISEENSIRVEDDGHGMSYRKGGIAKYLGVAKLSRTDENDSVTELGRKKMGRKGIGKLAALSVSENVDILTISEGEKSGFVLSRHPDDDGLLKPINDIDIHFEKIDDHGTAIVMKNPEYRLHKTNAAIKRNIVNIFPLIDRDFRIHIINKDGKDDVIERMDDIFAKIEEIEFGIGKSVIGGDVYEATYWYSAKKTGEGQVTSYVTEFTAENGSATLTRIGGMISFSEKGKTILGTYETSADGITAITAYDESNGSTESVYVKLNEETGKFVKLEYAPYTMYAIVKGNTYRNFI